MAKLTDFFGLKGTEAEADKFLAPIVVPHHGPHNGNGEGNGESGPADSGDPTFVGARLGEENEALRNLLIDAGRKIGDLDSLITAF